MKTAILMLFFVSMTVVMSCKPIHKHNSDPSAAVSDDGTMLLLIPGNKDSRHKNGLGFCLFKTNAHKHSTSIGQVLNAQLLTVEGSLHESQVVTALGFTPPSPTEYFLTRAAVMTGLLASGALAGRKGRSKPVVWLRAGIGGVVVMTIGALTLFALEHGKSPSTEVPKIDAHGGDLPLEVISLEELCKEPNRSESGDFNNLCKHYKHLQDLKTPEQNLEISNKKMVGIIERVTAMKPKHPGACDDIKALYDEK